MPRARNTGSRVDANHREILDALNAEPGVTAVSTAEVGRGFPDICVGFADEIVELQRVNLLLEVKDEDKPPSKRKLTPDEQRFHEWWQGQVCTVKNKEEALALVRGE